MEGDQDRFVSLVLSESHISSNGGGFRYFLFSSLFVEMIQFDFHIFQMGGWEKTTN